MRNKCPVCMSEHRNEDWKMSFEIPDGWTIPSENIICQCKQCGFVYYDNAGTQEGYNEYYSKKYGFGLSETENYTRLDTIAAFIVNTFKDKSIRVRDFGGGDGYLTKHLTELGFTDARTWNVGEPEPVACDLLVASHVLEHLYDLDYYMQIFSRVLNGNGYFLAEVPDSMGISLRSSPPLLDYQTKHCNHFAPFHLDLLFCRYGFSAINQTHPEISNQNIKCYRVLYQLDYRVGMWERSKTIVTVNMRYKIDKLKKLKKPVIIWGCGDTTWHLLAQVPELKVVSFVDKDSKAYPTGATINGIPVYNFVMSDDPILVLAQGQRQSIIDSIQEAGLNNEVIEI